jgi:DNA-binding NarL/FixJ family response regulator
MISIAILEDNHHFRKGLEKIIESMDNTRLLASFRDAEEAISRIPEIAPDVFIVDINLQGLSGIDFLKRAKPILSKTEFMVCTIHDDNSTILDSLRNGATGYLLKDSSANEVKEAILEIKAGGSPMSAYISRKVIALFSKLPIEQASPSYNLTAREGEVLSLLSTGLLYKEIADRLNISTGTIKKHIRNIYEKLQVQNKVEAVNKFRDR